MGQEPADDSRPLFARPRVSIEELSAAKKTRPIRSVDDLRADTFDTDEELEEFLCFTRSERNQDVA